MHKIRLNQTYKIEGIFTLPWGECYGTLYLDPHHPYLEVLTKLPVATRTEYHLPTDTIIKGDTCGYGKITILNPQFKSSEETGGMGGDKLVKITIIARTILSCENDYSQSPLFKKVRLFINGTKEWLGKSDKEVDETYDKGERVNVFTVKLDKKFTVKNNYARTQFSGATSFSFSSTEIRANIEFDFDEKKSITEIQEVAYQWLILQSLLSGLYTQTDKITLHNEVLHKMPDGKHLRMEDKSYLYFAQRSDRDFDEVKSNADIWHQKHLGDLNFEQIINKWFARSEGKISIGNLFYSSATQLIFTADKFLNMVRAIEGYAEEKAIRYVSDEDIEEFRKDEAIQSALSKYITKPKNFIRRISLEKNSLQDRIALIIDDVPEELLKIICWNKSESDEENSDAAKIVKLRNNCSHWKAGNVGKEYVRETTEFYYKMKFILIYLQLSELGIPSDQIITSICHNQKFAPVILDYLQRKK